MREGKRTPIIGIVVLLLVSIFVVVSMIASHQSHLMFSLLAYQETPLEGTTVRLIREKEEWDELGKNGAYDVNWETESIIIVNGHELKALQRTKKYPILPVYSEDFVECTVGTEEKDGCFIYKVKAKNIYFDVRLHESSYVHGE